MSYPFPVQNRSDGRLEKVVSESEEYAAMLDFTIYLCEGAVIALLCLPFVFAVGIYRHLRAQKEYVIYAALSFANGMYGVGFVIAGIGRLIKYSHGTVFVLTSRWDCFTTPWTLIFTYFGPLCTLMQLVVTFDRFLSISFPLRYFTLTSRYAFRLISCVYLYQFIPFGFFAYYSYQYQVPENPAICYMSMGTSPFFYKFFLGFRFASSVASIFLYIPTLILIKKAITTVSGVQNQTKLRRINNITTTVGITVFFTFISVVPDLTSLLALYNASWNWVYYIIPQLSGFFNSVFYTLRYKDLRNATKSLFMCRCIKCSIQCTTVQNTVPSIRVRNSSNTLKQAKDNNQQTSGHGSGFQH